MNSFMTEANFVAALRYELGDGHVYDFVEGTVEDHMAPGLWNF